MNRIIILTFLIFITTQLLSQEYKIVNAKTLNVREYAGTEFEIIGKIHKDDKVKLLSEENEWSHIETDEGLTGYVSTEYLSIYNESVENTERKENKEKKGDNIWLYIIIGIIIIASIFGGKSSKSKSSSSKKTTKKQPISSSSRISVVYRFRIKGSGTAGGVKYADGMNIEVAVNGLGASGSPFNNIVEKLFVQEFASKYNIEPRFHSGIKMLFKQDRVDVEIM
jgi:hypothetical protein